MAFQGGSPAPQVGDLLGERVPEVPADIAVEVEVGAVEAAAVAGSGSAHEARRPLGEGHVAEPPLEVVPIALGQHEPVAVRRLARQAGDVVVLAQRDRRRVVGRRQVDRGAGRAARNVTRTARPGPSPARGRRPGAGRGTVQVRLRHLGQGAHPVARAAASRPRSAGRRPTRPARPGRARCCRAGRGRASAPRPPGPAPPARGPPTSPVAGAGRAGRPRGCLPERRWCSRTGPTSRGALGPGQVEDEVPGPPAVRARWVAAIPSRGRRISTVAPGHAASSRSTSPRRSLARRRGRCAGRSRRPGSRGRGRRAGAPGQRRLSRRAYDAVRGAVRGAPSRRPGPRRLPRPHRA